MYETLLERVIWRLKGVVVSMAFDCCMTNSPPPPEILTKYIAFISKE